MNHEQGEYGGLRMTIQAQTNNGPIYYYDKGCKYVEDPHNLLSTHLTDQHPTEPRYLEDIIKEHGKNNVKIIDYGPKYSEIASVVGMVIDEIEE